MMRVLCLVVWFSLLLSCGHVLSRNLNSFAGPFIAFVHRFDVCPSDGSGLLYIKNTHFNPSKPFEKQRLTGNATMKWAFDDSAWVHVNIAVRSNNQWKANAFILDFPGGGCTALRTHIPSFFQIVTRVVPQLNNKNEPCRVPPMCTEEYTTSYKKCPWRFRVLVCSGIGAGAALYLAKLGCRLVLNGRNEANLTKVRNQCVECGLKSNEIVTVIGSVEDTEDCKRIIETAGDSFGQIDILVNNAAVEIVGTTDSMPVEEFDRQFQINVRSVFQLTQFALPYLEKTKGNVVNVSSVASTTPIRGTLAYGTSKAAVDHLSRNMAVELGPKGVRVNCVNPGVIVTEFQRRAGMPQDTYDQFLRDVSASYPLRRVGHPEDVAKAIAFLASDLASFITGETLYVDGGHHLAVSIAPWGKPAN